MSNSLEQQLALEAVINGENVCVLGKAGCGKSFVINQILDRNTILCAPTGMAALNIGGATCHRIFGLPIGSVTTKDLNVIPKKMEELFNRSSPVKRIVLDECFRGDTEVLTSGGFKAFSSISMNDELAQFDENDNTISFSNPIRIINKDYNGEMIKFSSKHKINFECTANHELLLRNPSGTYKKQFAKDVKCAQRRQIKSGGYGSGEDCSLSIYERLSIVFQADGSTITKEYSDYSISRKLTEGRRGYSSKKGCGSMRFSFKKSKKIERFIELFSDLEMIESDIKKEGYRTFIIRNVPSKYITKDFNECFNIKDFSYNKCCEFLEELKYWDGSIISENSFIYINTNLNSVNFVQSVCVLSNCYSSLTKSVDNRKDTYSDCYKLTIARNRDFSTMVDVEKSSYHYEGKVYCAEMPKGTLIIRSNGRTHIVGNCSQLRIDYLGLIDYRLKKIRGNDLPFGGIQMCVFGDFFQLSPIVAQNEEDYFYDVYESPYAFDSHAWNFKTIELTKVFRQEDVRQVAMLDSIRRKDKHHKKALSNIMKEAKPYNPSPDVTHLCCYREDAHKYNEMYYKLLQGKEYLYNAKIVGNDKWKDSIVPHTVKLKVGAKVMFKANDMDDQYVNGEKGTVLELSNHYVLVKKDNGNIVSVTYNKWEKFTYVNFGKDIEKEVTGTFEQIPLVLSYAATIHSVQGCTLDEVVIDTGRGCFSHGQLYMALSRVRNLENIAVVGHIGANEVIVDDRVLEFYNG